MERQRGIEIGERPSHRLSEIVWRPRCPCCDDVDERIGTLRDRTERLQPRIRLGKLAKLTSLTTPITSSRGGWQSRPMRFPRGFSFGQKRRAIVSLMITTSVLPAMSLR